jgi:glycosyltransferase involved in cell wall biosynthesis
VISVCIATYGDNVWAELAERRALPSAIKQDCEVILEHQPDGTLASARNAAAAKATHKRLVFLDADDELDGGFVAAMDASSQNYAMHLPRTSFAKNGHYGRPHFFSWCDLRDGNPMVIGTVIPTQAFTEVGGFTENVELFEDWMLFAQLWKLGLKVVTVPDAVYVAHVVRKSRNRQSHGAVRLYWHQWIGHQVFPDHYEPTTTEEDMSKKLASPQIRVIT